MEGERETRKRIGEEDHIGEIRDESQRRERKGRRKLGMYHKARRAPSPDATGESDTKAAQKETGRAPPPPPSAILKVSLLNTERREVCHALTFPIRNVSPSPRPPPHSDAPRRRALMCLS